MHEVFTKGLPHVVTQTSWNTTVNARQLFNNVRTISGRSSYFIMFP